MTQAEQRRLMDDLVRVQWSMNTQDKEEFSRLQSRQKDDEDFDAATTERLEALHHKYRPSRSKDELNALWKKMAGGGDKRS